MQGSGSAPVGSGAIVGSSQVCERARDKPFHHFFDERVQYRLKVQRFSSMPEEVTVQQIDFGPDQDRYLRAAAEGRSHVGSRRASTDRGAVQDAESLQRSERRAKTRVRLLVTELAPTALVTFTSREVMPLDALLWVWSYFNRLTRQLGVAFEYVAVPERHPKNPDHLHIHAAVRGRVSISTLRRLWHISLEARHGRKVGCILRGPASPGNIDVQTIKGRDQVRRIRRIARYVSKYITKELIAEFNRRRYWPSKGISLEEAQRFWLSSLSQVDAIREACGILGHLVDDEPLYRPFMPSERVAWWAAEARAP